MKDNSGLPPLMTSSRIAYHSWAAASKLSNGLIDLVVLTEVGPRVAFFGLSSGVNQLHEIAEQNGLTGGSEFRIYGGHRLWVSPEVARTYYPDNHPVSVETGVDSVVFTAPPEDDPPGEGLRKQIEISLEPGAAHATLVHRIRNCSRQTTELAPWAITVMAGGGKAILPLPPRAPFSSQTLLPTGGLILWPYTDLADPRWTIGTKYLQLRQQASSAFRFQEQMGGIYSPLGWAAYFRGGHLFVKRADVVPGAPYPDFGCNLEVFTDPHSLEVETLGPLVTLAPGEEVVHREDWWLFSDLPAGNDDAWVDEVVLPALERAAKSISSGALCG
jgi:hypothetical protein